MKLVHTKYPYKGPIDVPCSACSAGDKKMEYHDHDYVKPEHRRGSSSPSYTLAEWKSQVFDYCDEWERKTKSTQTGFRLMLSLMFESMAKKEREVTNNG